MNDPYSLITDSFTSFHKNLMTSQMNYLQDLDHSSAYSYDDITLYHLF